MIFFLVPGDLWSGLGRKQVDIMNKKPTLSEIAQADHGILMSKAYPIC